MTVARLAPQKDGRENGFTHSSLHVHVLQGAVHPQRCYRKFS